MVFPRVVLTLSILICLFGTTVVIGQDVNNYRLPTNVIPSHYEIELTPYFQNETNGKIEFTFDGLSKITLRTTQNNVNEIVVQINQLYDYTINLALELTPTTQIGVTSAYTPLNHKLTLTLNQPLVANVDYILTFQYYGILNTDMSGFYRSSYLENGVLKWLGTTQFQPVHARRVFPCFDEPSFKATFQVTIFRPAHFQRSISNTPISTSELIGTTRVRETFHRTPKMSTYLLAFIVSEFKERSNNDNTFIVAARPDAYEQTLYAFDVGQKLLAKMDEWTQYNYSSVPEMTKMHQAALPDFSAGAMENWGLLTYRETGLLYDPLQSTSISQQRIASVITHEISHMWFGNLVTCEWWGYTWLNEGFARYFTFFGAAMVEDQWNLELQFVVEQLQGVFGNDALTSTHAMSFEVYSPAQVSTSFDTIAYNKGGSILRMMEHLMGWNSFNLAIQQYLRDNEYSTSTPEKLFSALQQQTSINVSQLLNTWTTQPGYPLVTIERQEDRKTFIISQKRFLLREKDHNDQTTWEIHLNYATPTEHSFLHTSSIFSLEQSQVTRNYTIQQETDWAIFNIQQTGYYRVNYDNNTWTNIGTALKNTNHSGIHVLNRAQIVDDILNLARADYVDYWQALSVVQYLEKEENYIPWLSAINNLLYVSRRLTPSQYDEYKKYFIKLSANIYSKLGFHAISTDSRIDVYNRANILNYNCKFGHEECINSAKEEFTKLRDNSSYIVDANIRSVVYCTALADGGESEWDFLWNKFLVENVAAEQIVILNALGCTKAPTVLTKYMNAILSNSVRQQDKSAAFTATYNEQIDNVPVVFNYIKENFERVSEVLTVPSILSNLAARFSTLAQIDELVEFHQIYAARFGESTTITNAITEARFNLNWATNHVPIIYNYLEHTNSSVQIVAFKFLIIFVTIFTFFKQSF